MRTLSCWAAPLLAVTIAGCKGREQAPACEPTLAAAVDRMVAEAKRAAASGPLARIEAGALALRQALLASCAADEWSAAALRCFTGVALPADLEACTAKLTHEQYVRVHQKIDPLLAPVPAVPTPSTSGSAAPPDPAASVGSGSGAAAPSPGSGSAPPAAPAAGSASRPPAARPKQPPAPDCSRVVVDPDDPRCRAQYCRAHPDDLRCAE